MTFPQILSLVLLVLILVLSIWRHVNIGLLGFCAAAVMVTATQFYAVTGSATAPDPALLLTSKSVFEHFPGSIVTLLIGVSLLFGHFERSGSLSWLTDKVYKAIGEHTLLIPWVGYMIGLFISTAGAFSTATITLLVPVIAALGRRMPKIFFISEVAAIVGANTGALSPINPVGTVIRDSANHAQVNFNGWLLWLLGTIVSVSTVLVLQIIFSPSRMQDSTNGKKPARGLALLKPVAIDNNDKGQLNPAYAICSTLSVLFFITLVVFAGTDVGLTAISLAVLLLLLFPKYSKNLARNIPWNAVVVISGLLVFIGTMMSVHTMDALENRLLGMTTNQIILLFIITYLTTSLSNVESSTIGVISLMTPMIFTIFGGSAHMSLILAACVAPALLSVINPIHIAGTLVVSYTDEKQQDAMFRRLLTIAFFIVPIIPGLTMILPAVML